jgi:hypothetical protein
MTSIPLLLRRLSQAAVVLAALASGAAAAVSPSLLTASSLPYEVYRGGSLLGEGTVSLKPAGPANCWFYTQEAKPRSWLRLLSGDVLEQSNFCIQDGKLRPVAYRYNRDGVGTSKENFSLRFDWAKQQAIYQTGDVKNLPEGTVDRLSMQLILRDWLISEKALTGKEPTGEREVLFADRKKIDSYVFQVRAHERVETPAGVFDTTRLDRTDSTKRRTQFWLSPAHGYIVVKAEQQREDDPVIRLLLKRLPESLSPAP